MHCWNFGPKKDSFFFTPWYGFWKYCTVNGFIFYMLPFTVSWYLLMYCDCKGKVQASIMDVVYSQYFRNMVTKNMFQFTCTYLNAMFLWHDNDVKANSPVVQHIYSMFLSWSVKVQYKFVFRPCWSFQFLSTAVNSYYCFFCSSLLSLYYYYILSHHRFISSYDGGYSFTVQDANTVWIMVILL